MTTKKKDVAIPDLPQHESGVRRMVADATGRPYRAFRSLTEAQADPDGVVIFEGDDGGQIYLVCPARAVRCSEDMLRVLLQDVDARGWNDPTAARVFFEALPVEAAVPGGMGGGRVTNALWVHATLSSRTREIQEVIEGARARLT